MGNAVLVTFCAVFCRGYPVWGVPGGGRKMYNNNIYASYPNLLIPIGPLTTPQALVVVYVGCSKACMSA